MCGGAGGGGGACGGRWWCCCRSERALFSPLQWRRPIFGAALGFLFCSMPLEISPGPETQLFSSPSTKGRTIGEGELSVRSRAKREKTKMHRFGGSVFSTTIAESIALSEHPP